MTRTLGQLVTAVRDRLDEPVERFWTDVQIRTWLNDAARDVARQAECLQATSSIAITGGTQTYTGPVDTIRIYRAEYNRTGDSQKYSLTFRDFNNMDEIWYTSQTIHRSTPTYYTFWGFPPSLQIVLYPTPDVDGTLKVFYYRLPGDLSTTGSDDATTIDIPAGWEDVLVDYAEFNALRKDNSPRWQEAKSLYEEKLADLVGTTQRFSDQEGMIVSDSGQGTTPYWLYGGAY